MKPMGVTQRRDHWGVAAALLLLASAVGSAPAQANWTQTITWQGALWQVKNGDGGPGQDPLKPGHFNHWSGSPDNVWVDSMGRLHLKITPDPRVPGQWNCAEVRSVRTVGPAIYSITLISPPDQLDSNAVLGFFSYANDFHEADIEFSRWGNPASGFNIQYVVQPHYQGGPTRRFRWTIGPAAPTRHFIDWRGTLARFQTQNSAGSVIQQQGLPAANPTAAQRLHLNLWLNQTHPPRGDGSLEAIISTAGIEPLHDEQTGAAVPAGVVPLPSVRQDRRAPPLNR